LDLDYYKILGVDKNASNDEIKKAYKKLAIKYHPDKNDNDELSTEVFKKVKNAYETLSNPTTKVAYDNKQAYYQTPNNQSSKKTHNTSVPLKNKGISNKKASLLAISFVFILATIVLILYPLANKWASNDKFKTAEKLALQENWPEAYVYTSEAIEQWDENGKAYLLRAKIKSSIYKKYDKALIDFNQAFFYLPQDSILGSDYYMRAKCNHELGRLDETCSDLQISLQKGFQQASTDIAIICD